MAKLKNPKNIKTLEPNRLPVKSHSTAIANGAPGDAPATPARVHAKYNTIEMRVDPAKTQERSEVDLALSSTASNAFTSRAFVQGIFGPLNISDCVASITDLASQVQRGDMSGVEGRLLGQAIALEMIFHDLARRAVANFGEYLDAGEQYMRLALKAQSQSRAALETLAEIKNPTGATFVRQANIAHGPQQVNNSTQAEVSRAGKTELPQSKLLEQTHGERLDNGTAGQAIGSDPPMAAVGTIDRAKNGSG